MLAVTPSIDLSRFNMKTFILTALLCLFLALAANAASLTITEGQGAKITVTASGTAPFTYQWAKNGVLITGATSATYVVASTTPADSGTYTVVVSNSAGSTTSDNAALTVNIKVIPPSNAVTTITAQ